MRAVPLVWCWLAVAGCGSVSVTHARDATPLGSVAVSFIVLQFSYRPGPPAYATTVVATLISASTGGIQRRVVVSTDDPTAPERLGAEVCRAALTRPREAPH